MTLVVYQDHGNRDGDDRASIVGLWQFAFVSKGNADNPSPMPNPPDLAPLDSGFAQWHSDGTEIMNSARDPATGSFCLGVWKSDGPRTYTLKSLRVELGRHRNTLHAGSTASCFVGPTNIREHITVDRQGDSYAGDGDDHPVRHDWTHDVRAHGNRLGAAHHAKLRRWRAARARSACACTAAAAVGPSDSDLRRPRSRGVRQEEQVSFERGARMPDHRSTVRSRRVGRPTSDRCGRDPDIRGDNQKHDVPLCATRANGERACPGKEPRSGKRSTGAPPSDLPSLSQRLDPEDEGRDSVPTGER